MYDVTETELDHLEAGDSGTTQFAVTLAVLTSGATLLFGLALSVPRWPAAELALWGIGSGLTTAGAVGLYFWRRGRSQAHTLAAKIRARADI